LSSFRILLDNSQNVFGQQATQPIGRLATEMRVLAGPPFSVDVGLVILHELPPIAAYDCVAVNTRRKTAVFIALYALLQ